MLSKILIGRRNDCRLKTMRPEHLMHAASRIGGGPQFSPVQQVHEARKGSVAGEKALVTRSVTATLERFT